MRFSLFQKLFGRKNRPSQRRQPARFRPQLECLEARTLLNATIYVNAADASVPLAQQDGSKAHPYGTIQQGVDAASSGATVKVAAGYYNEQVTIGLGKNGVQLEGAGQNSTTIQGGGAATQTIYNATVEVDGAQNVTIDGFTIKNSPTVVSNGNDLNGIRIDDGGSATITNNHITDIEDPSADFGLQEGIGIDVGRHRDGTTGSAIISHNLIDNYQKGGIVVDNAGSSAEIDHNTITGVGPNGQTAQNGIQISRGATADVNHNDVSGNVFTGAVNFDDEGTGILLYQVTGSVLVDHNTLSHNDVGIEVEDSTGPNTEIDHNQATANTHNGIVLDATSGVQLDHNDTSNNGNNAVVPVQDDNGNVVSQIRDGGIALVRNSMNNTIDHNQSQNNKGDGIYVDSSSTGNTFTHNQLKGNTHDDAEDASTGTGTAGTGNTWDKNKGETSSPAGLVS